VQIIRLPRASYPAARRTKPVAVMTSPDPGATGRRWIVASELPWIALVAAVFALTLAASWHRWSDPIVDVGREMNQPRFLDTGDHANPNARLTLDCRDEIAAVVGFARGGGGSRQDFVDLVRRGQPAEFGQRLEPGGHGCRCQAATVEAAGPQANHFLFPVNDFEREIGPHLDHDHVDRVGADVDGGYSHGGRGRSTASQRILGFCYMAVIYCVLGRVGILP